MSTHDTEATTGRDALPLVARLYEVQALEALRSGTADGADEARAPRTDEPAPSPPPGPDRESALPFIGKVSGHVPGRSITIERTLDLAEDLYLADHAFVHAPGVKPLSACLPVLPMTMSLEVMAEAAACLAPGLGPVGFEDIKALRWIELADTETLPLRVVAQALPPEPHGDVLPVAVELFAGAQASAAMTGRVLFGAHYPVELTPRFTELVRPQPLALTGEALYAARHLFHGPRFQCVTGPVVVAERGLAGTLRVSATGDLFRSLPRPQLLTDPALLDGVGQLLGLWAMQRERYAFPIGFRKLELYRGTPPAGTRVPVRLEIVRDEAKTVYADVEVQDGSGGVWMRIQDWGAWKFRWPPALVDFRRQPTRHCLSRPLALPGLPPSAACRVVDTSAAAGFDWSMLARHLLTGEEMADFRAKADMPPRQRQWLLGRIAAKDALRACLAARSGSAEMLHPAAVAIANDAKGRPAAAGLEAYAPLPGLSLAHCEDRAVAIAGDEPLGIDVERIVPREAAFLDTVATAAERALLAAQAGATAGPTHDEWVTRLWCAKEAAGKSLGTGVEGGPQRFQAVAADPAGTIRIRPPGDTSRVIEVHSLREGDFIVAWTQGAGTASTEEAAT